MCDKMKGDVEMLKDGVTQDIQVSNGNITIQDVKECMSRFIESFSACKLSANESSALECGYAAGYADATRRFKKWLGIYPEN